MRKVKPHLCRECNETDPAKFYPKSKGLCKVHSAARSKKAYNDKTPAEKAEYMAKQRVWKNSNFWQVLHLGILHRAKNKPYTYGLDASFHEDLFKKQKGLCYLSGKEMIPQINHKETVSMDRINSSLGYPPANVALCCSVLNSMKMDLDTEEFLDLCQSVIEYRRPELLCANHKKTGILGAIRDKLKSST